MALSDMLLRHIRTCTRTRCNDMNVPCCARRAWDVQEPNGQVEDTRVPEDVDMEASHHQDEEWQAEGHQDVEWDEGEEEVHVEGHDTGTMSP